MELQGIEFLTLYCQVTLGATIIPLISFPFFIYP
jgi:hypothetical protein